MMNAGDMVEGFVKQAVDMGYTDESIAILFKIAVDAGVIPTVSRASNHLKQLMTNPAYADRLSKIIDSTQPPSN